MSECHNDQATTVGIQQAIAKQNGGKTLELPVIYAWLSHECQGFHNPTNPLNILGTSYVGNRSGTMSPGNGYSYNVYPSLQAGYDGTADYLLHSGHYGGIIATMAPAGSGNATAQAQAIQHSPWDGSYPGLDTTVQKIITVSGQFPSWLTGSGGASPVGAGAGSSGTPTPAPTSVSLDVILTQIYGKFGDTYSPSDNLTQDEVNALYSHLFGDGTPMNTGDPNLTTAEKTTIMGIVNAPGAIGKPLGSIKIPIALATKLGVSASGGLVGVGPTDPKTGATQLPTVVTTAFDSLVPGLGKDLAFIADPQNWLYVGALMLGLYFAIHGYQRLGEA